MLSEELQEHINSSKIIICRSGYSSILDAAVLGKKVFFIPTENQLEQQYLGKYLEQNKRAPFSKIENFTSEKLNELKNYTGLNAIKTNFNKDLFRLFHCE